MFDIILNLIPEEEIIKFLHRKGYKVTNPETLKQARNKAHSTRQTKILEKINKAKLELLKQGKDINPYSISKQAKINYRTAIKYLKKEDPISQK